jgi:hypothetical protein
VSFWRGEDFQNHLLPSLLGGLFNLGWFRVSYRFYNIQTVLIVFFTGVGIVALSILFAKLIIELGGNKDEGCVRAENDGGFKSRSSKVGVGRKK